MDNDINVLFLGTGAADFSEGFLNGKSINETGNRSIRRSSSTILGEKILFDCGPFCINSIDLFGVDVNKIEYLFFTHSHSDHFNVENVKELARRKTSPLNVFCKVGFPFPSVENTVVNYLKVGDKATIDGFIVTAIEANHTNNPLHYSIEIGDKKIFYGLDGAWLLTDTYNYMQNKKYDLMILDATVGDYEGDYRMAEHNSLPMIRLMKKSFETFGIIDSRTNIVLDHIAQSLHKDYETESKEFSKEGFTLAYDGMKLKI